MPNPLTRNHDGCLLHVATLDGRELGVVAILRCEATS